VQAVAVGDDTGRGKHRHRSHWRWPPVRAAATARLDRIAHRRRAPPAGDRQVPVGGLHQPGAHQPVDDPIGCPGRAWRGPG
jgi:hypothetical protein